jgi:hypothetical protein
MNSRFQTKYLEHNRVPMAVQKAYSRRRLRPKSWAAGGWEVAVDWG